MKGKTLLSLAAGAGMALAAAGTASAAGGKNGLVAYNVVSGHSVPKSLTGEPGDPERGKQIITARKKGNCLACHKIPGIQAPYQGEVGPSLAGVASRRGEGSIRLQLIDSEKFNPNSVMPSFYKASGFHRVMDGFENEPILTAKELEDVIAYLMTLK